MLVFLAVAVRLLLLLLCYDVSIAVGKDDVLVGR